MTHTALNHIWRYVALCEDRGATAEEIHNATGLNKKTVSSRLAELHINGRLIPGEQRGRHHGHVYRVPAHQLDCDICGLDNDQEAHRAWDQLWQTLSPDQQRNMWNIISRESA